jgi:uncharacterized membrane protein
MILTHTSQDPQTSQNTKKPIAMISLAQIIQSFLADVGIAHHQLRRLVLAHGLLSFFFNTSILALVVNIIAGLF